MPLKQDTPISTGSSIASEQRMREQTCRVEEEIQTVQNDSSRIDLKGYEDDRDILQVFGDG